ncbi:hypothetical protein LSAT2_010531 [Lamellibrachia satsuma]|nr:hypothetical protein LSAT2_010531 [Lamellibrachia satsuma]
MKGYIIVILLATTLLARTCSGGKRVDPYEMCLQACKIAYQLCARKCRFDVKPDVKRCEVELEKCLDGCDDRFASD